jgi:protein-S-isoprenylcysteine O-methyltransferase Ste14
MISVLVIAWMVSAALAAPYLELWPMTVGVMWATAIVMLIATVLTVLGLTTPNPFSVPVKPDQFDPENPGILALTRHPLLLGLALWAGAHVLSNGALSAVILFGFAFVFSLAGMGILDARRKRHWGENVWNSRAAQTTLLSIRVQRMPLGDWRWVLVAVLWRHDWTAPHCDRSAAAPTLNLLILGRRTLPFFAAPLEAAAWWHQVAGRGPR